MAAGAHGAVELHVRTGGFLGFGGRIVAIPEGRYTLKVKVNLEGKTTERSAEFEMAGLDETLTADTAVLAVARETDEGYFAEMNEAELDSAAAPLVLIAKSRPSSGSRATRARRPSGTRSASGSTAPSPTPTASTGSAAASRSWAGRPIAAGSIHGMGRRMIFSGACRPGRRPRTRSGAIPEASPGITYLPTGPGSARTT